ncbi:hypothetical protein BP5796_12755 [Coleophoma crateriformis]|uniref:Heterokaryon incompatibility domain-containing protein n=1 Tax=Coleophoma crateriformis TaxID=565419 RepID=A0A3D8Q625_9HELO|nr:hypothetical protein BP5796_12755 [Coleophoma crateriformis]
MEMFQYELLSDDASAFRLLALSPGMGDAPINGTLSEDSREVSTFSYEALSYTWGSSTSQQHIILNNKSFAVTPNLYLALRNLRSDDSERILWVDAICINQSCPMEKTQQVSQMRNIYQAAESVLVWLGEGTEETGRALSWVASHSKDGEQDLKHLEQTARFIMDATPETPIEIEDDDSMGSGGLEAQDRRIQLLAGFSDLLSRPWWSRVWVIQEAVVNSDVRILCGHSQVSWTTFMAFTQGIYRSKPLLKAPLDETIKYHRAIERAFSRNQFMHQSPQKFLNLLLQYRGLDSSDPRDNVYALLGLASNMSNTKFSPDYSKSTSEVYRQLTRQIVKRHKDLTIICASQPPSVSTNNLPFWTPDWSAPWKTFCFAQVPYNACSFHTPDVTFSKDLTRLKATGLTISVIESTSATYETSGPTLVAWLKSVKNWRTLIGNWDNGSRPFAFDDFRQTYTQHVPGAELSYSVNFSRQTRKRAHKRSKKDVLRFQTQMNTMCWNRKVAHMRRGGREALVPSHARPGDEICVLYGCRVPVVLRSSGVDSWTFIGDAYVDGCMHGQVFNGYAQSDETQVFCFR